MSQSEEQAEDTLHADIKDLCARFDFFERLVSRRFDEISMEINATSQQIDMNDETTSKRFTEILEVLKAISYQGDGTTAANAGVELDAVVDMTEMAANNILDAAERISKRIQKSQKADNEEDRQQELDGINEDVEQILLACSFQDITGQRIKQTLENLRQIEDRLGRALSKIGIVVDADPQNHAALKNSLSSQQEIDDFFTTQSPKDAD